MKNSILLESSWIDLKYNVYKKHCKNNTNAI